MIRSFFWQSATAAAIVVLAACSSSTTNNNGSSGDGGSNGTTSSCNQPTTSTTDGSTACSPQCSAGEHCSMTGVNCIDGCTSTANCASGQYCDMTAATKDLEQNSTGLCRTPAACTTTSTGGSGSTTATSVVGCFSGSGASPTAACTTEQNCVITNCDAQLKVALGDGYASGSIGGACADFYTCASAGGCTESAQESCAGKETADCKTAGGNVSACIKTSCSAQVTACENSLLGAVTFDAGTGDDTSDAAATGECATLAACCATLTDANAKHDCTTESGTGNQALCANAEPAFCPDAD